MEIRLIRKTERICLAIIFNICFNHQVVGTYVTSDVMTRAQQLSQPNVGIPDILYPESNRPPTSCVDNKAMPGALSVRVQSLMNHALNFGWGRPLWGIGQQNVQHQPQICDATRLRYGVTIGLSNE
jgi:hypothetical protein